MAIRTSTPLRRRGAAAALALLVGGLATATTVSSLGGYCLATDAGTRPPPAGTALEPLAGLRPGSGVGCPRPLPHPAAPSGPTAPGPVASAPAGESPGPALSSAAPAARRTEVAAFAFA
jgi:hypothetical protein